MSKYDFNPASGVRGNALNCQARDYACLGEHSISVSYLPHSNALLPSLLIKPVGVFIHCVLCMQGFSAGLFAFYHDDDGKPLTPRFASGLPAFNER